jgi:predicted restriction endonuclease
MGIRILDEEKSARVFAGLFPPSAVREPEVTEDEFTEAIKSFDSDLDRQVQATARVEQAYLRRRLFGDRPTGKCALCGQEMPTDLLVAAHIKRRASSDQNERADVRNNVMAACAFGCDDLYERGYLAVDDDGLVIISPTVMEWTTPLGKRLAELRGRTCKASTDGSRGYFAWHREHIFRQPPPTSI